MQALDEKIILFFQSMRCEPLTVFFKLFIPVEIWYAVALALVLFFFFRTGTLRAPVISFIIARDLSNFSYGMAKQFFHRPRPFLTMHHAVPVITPHGFSFPSGHATLAMASAVVFAYHFPKARRLIYLLAVLAGLSRVYLGVHYLSDVLGGFVLGGLVGLAAIFLERGILALARGVQFNKKACLILAAAVLLAPGLSLAKGGDEQDRIILLNDSAAALEDSNPELAKGLTEFADEKERGWEANKANKAELPSPVTDKTKSKLQEHIKLLKDAAVAIEPSYPSIARSLNKMADGMNKGLENEK